MREKLQSIMNLIPSLHNDVVRKKLLYTYLTYRDLIVCTQLSKKWETECSFALLKRFHCQQLTEKDKSVIKEYPYAIQLLSQYFTCVAEDNNGCIIDTGARNSFHRLLTYVACKNAQIPYKRYKKWFCGTICKTHKIVCVSGCERGSSCCPRCPKLSYYYGSDDEYCDLTDENVKYKKRLVALVIPSYEELFSIDYNNVKMSVIDNYSTYLGYTVEGLWNKIDTLVNH